MPDVIPHLQRNIDAAELSPPPRAVAYEWGTEWGVEHTAAGTGSGTFGVVLAADCIYDTERGQGWAGHEDGGGGGHRPSSLPYEQWHPH